MQTLWKNTQRNEGGIMNTIDIRFGGFYESWHGDKINDAVYETDDNGDYIDDGKWISVEDYKKVKNSYGGSYVDFLNEELGTSMKLDRTDSPREYNFSTDVFIAECSKVDMERIIFEANEDYPSAFNKAIYGACTHSSGYIALNTVVELVAKRDMLASMALEVMINEELGDEWEQYFDLHCVYDNLRV